MSDVEPSPLPIRPVRTWPFWVPLVVTSALLALDQWTKVLAVSNLTFGQPVEVAIPGLLGFTLVYNTGAAWSLFQGSAFLLALLRFAVGVGLLVYMARRPQDRFHTVVFAIISAGAIGNAIDGIRQGKVTDMLSSPALDAVTRSINGQPFPIFNIADSCVVVGVILLLIASVVSSVRKPR
ncbi:signal peptidase II [Deinococcus yavapaiensis]|uniref:Lipoprotein signal peptidase n=1 Tax=Deinococcus yavapaiensis KR-236 TaxID=694435 RepID=A0A318S506_9DEIO|nr:signal peptidase II [Deinococcus yavapaiensis]PYE52685.1 signal peptidase II [Deinococcus yavapaiensis KR-236]